MPAAGRLDRLVTIEQLTIVQGETGEEEETWTFWQHAYMAMKDTRAQERNEAGQVLAVVTTTWASHWIEGMKYKTVRLNYEGVIYNITSIAELGRRSGLEIGSQAVGLA
jgi:head-tail adaptor